MIQALGTISCVTAMGSPLCQSRVVLSPFSSKAMLVLSLVWLLRLGLNPSTSLPLQPHFRLLPQSVTPASIPYSSSFTGLPE